MPLNGDYNFYSHNFIIVDNFFIENCTILGSDVVFCNNGTILHNLILQL